ncbi:MAG: OmpH family outer membrane protein [Paracoccaceae bacterium]
MAQQAVVTQSPILTVDSERVFATTIAGRQITEDLEVRLEALVRENRQIEAELVAEELDLTEKRKTMDPAAFRVLADAFDIKVQGIRARQDAKQRELQRLRDAERQSFIDQIAPILSGIGRERGAVVILERRNVLLSADNIDITEEAIARINLALANQKDSDAAADQNTPTDPGGGAQEGADSQ